MGEHGPGSAERPQGGEFESPSVLFMRRDRLFVNRQAFLMFDRDGGGTISVDEFTALMNALGMVRSRCNFDSVHPYHHMSTSQHHCFANVSATTLPWRITWFHHGFSVCDVQSFSEEQGQDMMNEVSPHHQTGLTAIQDLDVM